MTTLWLVWRSVRGVERRMVGEVELPGRAGIVKKLVGECVRRQKPRGGGEPGRELPVIVLFGPRGSGKTATLANIVRNCAHQVPHASIDVAKRARAPREIITELHFDLSKKHEGVHRIPFRQLDLCLLAVGAEPDPNNREKALAQVRAAASADVELSDRTRSSIESVIDGLLQAGALPWWSKLPIGALFHAVETFRWRRKLRRGAGIKQSMPKRSAKVLDVLVDIGVADADLLDEVFCAAFLADLRAAYLRRFRWRRGNCVVLLDNIDAAGGSRFADLLLSIRERSPREPDPLVLIATSRQWNPRWGSQGSSYRTPEQAGLADWTNGRDVDLGRDSWWYPVELRDLTVSEVANVGRTAADTTSAPFLHELTRGHPWSTRELRATLGDRPTGLAMRTVLERGVERPFADRARDYLLQDFDPAQREVLVGMSAAPNLDLATHAGVRGGTEGDAGALHEIRNRLWSVFGEQLVLHPWLRRLLLHELGNRPADHPQRWAVVHTRHRDHHRESGNVALSLYHALALEDLNSAVKHLRHQFEQIDDEAAVRQWLQLLELITSAPNRLPTDREPRDQVEELVRTAPADANLARLVAARWLMSDPLGDPGRSLRSIVRSEFEQLAKEARVGFVLLFAESEKYA